MQGTDALAIETKVLGEGLSDYELSGRVANKLANSPSFLIQISSSESLAVHKWVRI